MGNLLFRKLVRTLVCLLTLGTIISILVTFIIEFLSSERQGFLNKIFGFGIPEFESENLRLHRTDELRNKSIILSWNNFFTKDPLERIKDCRKDVTNSCFFTKDKSFSSIADAIVFHSRNIENIPVQSLRRQEQLYVFWTMESQKNAGNAQLRDGFFNWTMTFSPFSDVKDTYGTRKFVLRNKNSVSNTTQMSEDLFTKKQRAIFGLISNCEPRRMAFVKTIESVYPVHLAGACADWLSEWRSFCRYGDDCKQMVKESVEGHLFHFVLENSDCLGYVSEKTFTRLHHLSIPIASRRKCYEPYGFPENTFIFLDDYKDVEHFAFHLRYLERNFTAYNQYFKWRENYETVSTRHEENLCGLCMKIVEEKKKTNMTSRIIKDAFHSYTQCFDSPFWTLSNHLFYFSYLNIFFVLFTVMVSLYAAKYCWKSYCEKGRYQLVPTDSS